MDKNTQRFFFEAFFHVLEKRNVRYVVLHSWQTLPDVATSDIDMMIGKEETSRLAVILREVSEGTEWRLVQKLWYDVPWCFYYVFVSPDGSSSAAVDFVSDPKGIGEYRIKDEMILDHRVFSGLLYRLSPEMELAYKLAKRRVKGIFGEKDLAFVREYFLKSKPNVLRACMKELLPDDFIDCCFLLLQKPTSVDEWQRLMERDSPAFRFAGRRWRIRLHPMWFITTVERITNRVLHPTGYVIELPVGADLLAMPKFVFRRQIEIKGSASAWKIFCAKSSATLLVQRVGDARCDVRAVRETILESLARKVAVIG